MPSRGPYLENKVSCILCLVIFHTEGTHFKKVCPEQPIDFPILLCRETSYIGAILLFWVPGRVDLNRCVS